MISSKSIITCFLYLFILTTFITNTSGSLTSVLGRIALPDYFAVLSIFLFIISLPLKDYKISFPTILKAFSFLIFTLSIGLIASKNISGTVMELLVLLFLLLILVVFINTHFNGKDFNRLILIITTASFLTSFTGIWDVLSVFMGLPRFFPKDPETMNLAVSGFRNTGQAGAYIIIMLSILISIYYSDLYKEFKKKQQLFIKVTILISMIFLFLTVKVAAYIGFAIGMFLFALKKRNFSVVLFITTIAIFCIVIYINLENIAPSLYNWMNSKVESRLSSDGAGASFVSHNLSVAIQAFSDNPFIGSGYGGLAGSIYGPTEIHSTYFKIIGESGFIGMLGYFIFMLILLKKIFVEKIKLNPYNQFLINLQPFIIGFIVSWGYTFHLRKREFILLVLVVYLVHKLSKIYNAKRIN